MKKITMKIDPETVQKIIQDYIKKEVLNECNKQVQLTDCHAELATTDGSPYVTGLGVTFDVI
jgi:hypothetical protein